MQWPKVIVFDLFGTLLDPTFVRGLPRGFARDPDTFLRLWRRKQLEYTWLRSLMGRYADFGEVTRQAFEYSVKLQGLRLKKPTARLPHEALLRAQPFPEVPAALKHLSSRRLAVLSNATRRSIDSSLRRTRLRQFFRAVLSVDSAKIFKPSPSAYQVVLKALRVSRSQVLFVSSNYWDAAGAQSFGFSSCWVNRQNAPEDLLGVCPQWTVRDLRAVRNLLE